MGIGSRLMHTDVFQLIPQEQAEKLVNQTVLFPHDEERRYVIELDVFHQLHCLVTMASCSDNTGV